MKHITKQGAPRDYLDWCKDQRGKANEDYRCLSKLAKDSLIEGLVNEQGGLCAYTMRRITTNSSHVEHIKPETLCRKEKRGSDLEYNNLIACYPKEGMVNPFRYGAQQKDKWWENDGEDFVSPLHKKCETKFIFTISGEISAITNDVGAKTTIDVLKLDHPSLTEDRKRAIEEYIYGQDGNEQPSIKKATQLAETVCALNKSGIYAEYCVAIRHGLAEYIRDLEKRANNRKFKTQQQKKT